MKLRNWLRQNSLNLPSVWHAAIPTLAALFFAIQLIPVYQNDVFLHTLLGQHMAAGGSMAGDAGWNFGPHEDFWQNTMPASELVYFWLYKFLGWGGVALWAAIPATAFVLLFWQVALNLTADLSDRALAYRISGLATIIANLMFQSFFQTRPQSVVFALLPVVGWQLLQTAQTGKMPKWWQAGLFTWMLTCVHPTTILFAPLLMAGLVVHTLANRRDPAAVKSSWLKAVPVIASMVAATLLTPSGYFVYTSALSIQKAASGVTTEWLSISSIADPQVLVLLGLFGIWYLGVRTSQRQGAQVRVAPEFLLIAGLIVGFGSVRRTAAFAAVLISVVVFYRWSRVSRLKTATVKKRTALNQSIGVFGVAVLAWAIFAQVPSINIDQQRQPVQIVSALAATNANAAVYVDYDISSFVLFELRQKPGSTATVSFDGRLDYFGSKVLKDFVTLNEAQNLTNQQMNDLWQPYAAATDAILDSRSNLISWLTQQGWKAAKTQAGISPLGERITWVWLQAPVRVN